MLTVLEARQRAATIFAAAAIAESEAAIAKIFGCIKSKQTFGSPQLSEPDQLILMVLETVRAQRPQLPKEINVIFNFKTQQALVEMYWYGNLIQDTPSMARQHAITLMEAAEASEKDAFFYHFMKAEFAFEPYELQPLLEKFKSFRTRNSLEDLFHQ